MLYEEILALLEEVIGEKGKSFTVGKFSGIGWLDFHYKCTTYDGLYPRISLKQQANGVHIYVMSGEAEFLNEFIDIFGKSAIGKGCVRIKKLTPERQDGIVKMVEKIKNRSEKKVMSE